MSARTAPTAPSDRTKPTTNETGPVVHLFWVEENAAAFELGVDRQTLCGVWEAPNPPDTPLVLEKGVRDTRSEDCPACVRILALTHALQLAQGRRS